MTSEEFDELAEKFLLRRGLAKALRYPERTTEPLAFTVSRPKAKWVVGESTRVTLNRGNASTTVGGFANSWQQIGQWYSADGSCEAGTISVTFEPWLYTAGASPGSGLYPPGVAVMVQTGGDKGYTRSFYQAPCVVPFSGNSVTVSALPCRLPLLFGYPVTTSNPGYQPLEKFIYPYQQTWGSTDSYTSRIKATITEGWGSYPTQPVMLFNGAPAYANPIQGQPNNTFAFWPGGPVIPASISLTNVGASAVQFVVCDSGLTIIGGGSPNSGGGFASGIVPAGSSIGLGQGILSPCSAGLSVVATTSIAASGFPYTNDSTNGGNLFVTATGYLLE